MVEYLYDCIRATAGDKVEIAAIIETAAGEPITEGCHLMLFNKDCSSLLLSVDGEYLDEVNMWQFTLPAEETKDKLGRFWYKICANDQGLCFRQPIYFVV